MSKKTQENKDLAAIWKKLEQLEVKIQKAATEDQQIASNASRAASNYKNRTEETKKQAETYLSEIKKIKIEIEHNKSNIDTVSQNISENKAKIETDFEQIKSELTEVQQKKSELEGLVNQLNDFFDENTDIDEKIENLKTLVASTTETNSKISQVLKNAVTRKSELDELYFEIIGYEEEDEETGEKTQIEGKKDELEKAYSDLSDRLNQFKKQLSDHQLTSLKSYEDVKTGWEKKFLSLEKEIQELLPNALTAGLSSAYASKKQNEEQDLKKRELNFRIAILGLVLVSCIPFFAANYMINNGHTFNQTILNLPRILLSILPLYIPVLWLAFSANKKMNLSKRLIEEYTHKEVISRTFEGLSKQIESIPNSDISNELRIKLLFNLVSTSSENPGKLISDYNKSDHPIIDALEKSSKLSDAVDRLEKIPGMKKVATILEKRAEKILNKQANKIEEALDSVVNERP